MEIRRTLPPDVIPSIDEPTFRSRYDGDGDDEVIAVSLGEASARAYPKCVLNYHEVVNDVLGGRPIAVTWCPLCASAVVYDRVIDGRTLSFGVSGKLADDDVVLYDRETESEWKQSLGECIAGELEGETMTPLPAAVTTWKAFHDRYSDGVVLQPPGGASELSPDGEIDYDVNPFAKYLDADGLRPADADEDGPALFPESREWDLDLDPKTVVVGIGHDEDAVAVPEPTARESGVLEVSVGSSEVIVFGTDGEVHAFESPGFEVESTGSGGFEGDGALWDPATGRSDDGRSLERVPTKWLFAFAWVDDHGAEGIYRA